MDVIYRRGRCPAGAIGDIQYFFTPSCTSTMETARVIARSSPGILAALRSATQRKGRGRGEKRQWSDEPGKSLLCTWMLPAGTSPLDLQLIPLAAASAVLQAVDIAGEHLKIKWPNDLLWGERKLCGVLCEAKAGAVLVGIGLNVHHQRIPGSFRREPVSLEEITGNSYDLDELVCQVSASLGTLLHNYDPASALPYLYGKGHMAVFRPGTDGAEVLGRIAGIAPDGALKLETSGGICSCYSGEIIRLEETGLES